MAYDLPQDAARRSMLRAQAAFAERPDLVTAQNLMHEATQAWMIGAVGDVTYAQNIMTPVRSYLLGEMSSHTSAQAAYLGGRTDAMPERIMVGRFDEYGEAPARVVEHHDSDRPGSAPYVRADVPPLMAQVGPDWPQQQAAMPDAVAYSDHGRNRSLTPLDPALEHTLRQPAQQGEA